MIGISLGGSRRAFDADVAGQFLRDVANAIKLNIYRLRPSGSPGDWDMLSRQQYGPLLKIEIP